MAGLCGLALGEDDSTEACRRRGVSTSDAY
jgi:hypothetical protein